MKEMTKNNNGFLNHGLGGFMNHRYWIAKQPEKYKRIKDSRVQWQPKKLTFKEGLSAAPIPALLIYVVILIILFVLVVIAMRILPTTVKVGQLFDLYAKEYPTLLFLGTIYIVQIYLIYRDIIRRSMSRILCVIPVMYFLLAVNIILYL